MGQFSRWKTPPTVPSDTVIPLNSSDDTAILRSVCLVITYRYDDVLDPEKLRRALERLVDRDGWRKVGGRLRLNKEGKLEYHIPEHFDEKRPAISYSHISYDMDINEHSLASRLPRATQRPAVLADPSEFLGLAQRPDGPKVLNDYLYSDEPQLALHIVSFFDATLVSISLPHTLTDGTGGGKIYLSWSLALQGRDDEIPAFHGFDNDPLATFGAIAPEPYMYTNRLVTGWKAILFKLRQWYDSVRYRSESRVLCIPAAVMAHLRKTAIEEIRAETKNDQAFVSDNDVICAWFTQLAISDTPQHSDRTIRIMNAFSLASVLGDDHIPTAKAYISNAATEIYAFLSARDIYSKPLSHTAYAVRHSMMEGGTRNQVEALAALKRQMMAEKGEPPIFGDATMEMISFSNWSKGKFLETDFSSAIIKEGSPRAARANRPGIPSYIQFNAWSKKFQIRNIIPIMGKDAAGNYWLQGPLRAGVWEMIDKKLKAAD
ncbi:hypothetical protein LZ31DRAFT_481325 [Colletotrichum somersetense]|nr:hypothetical protein LZ31DRAFT_481325 [Colletotrichum somersetense]